MGPGRLDGVLDNRPLRTKIAAAVLTAILSGVIVGVVAVTTIGSMNEESATARRQTVAVLSASGTFAKNVEAFSGGLFALQLYPQAAGEINEVPKRPARSTRAWRRAGGPSTRRSTASPPTWPALPPAPNSWRKRAATGSPSPSS
jgi:hypothetical protein